MPTTYSPDDPASYELGLPPAQRWLNGFCENWIFALMVAMAVRHFAVEAFRIPTASMEPMLYGDPGFTHSDHVLVDKLLFRFQALKRWEVTVFQYPLPEVDLNGQPVSAIDAAGNRLDNVITRPLEYRNFVKRAIILPGDTFYIADGDVFLQQPDKTFKAARKPPEVQAALWQRIYDQADAGEYQPWSAGAGSSVSGKGPTVFALAKQGTIAFNQPLINLYLKPGLVKVRPAVAGVAVEGSTSTEVQVSMTSPQFTYAPNGMVGSIWDLDDWEVSRLTSADLDSDAAGTVLNGHMNEHIKDVRVSLVVSAVSGEAVIDLSEGRKYALDLHLTPEGWSLDENGHQVATGKGSPVGHAFALSNLDEQQILDVDGTQRYRVDIDPVDPQRERTAISLHGAGSLTCGSLFIDRDIYYSTTGMLKDESRDFADWTRALNQSLAQSGMDQDRADYFASRLRTMRRVRAEMRGMRVDQFKGAQQWEAWGVSPETAITAPAGAYLMLGDNSPISFDGREWGWVPRANLRGRVIAVVFPRLHWVR